MPYMNFLYGVIHVRKKQHYRIFIDRDAGHPNYMSKLKLHY